MEKIDFKKIQYYFHLPMDKAANKLNVSLTVLKSLCKKYNINRWPYRKIHSLKIIIDGFKNQLEELERKTNQMILENNNNVTHDVDKTIVASVIITAKELSDNLIKEIQRNQERLQNLYENPNIKFTKLVNKNEFSDLKKRARCDEELFREHPLYFINQPAPKFQKLDLSNLPSHVYLPEIINEIKNDKLFDLMEKQAAIILAIEKNKQKLAAINCFLNL